MKKLLTILLLGITLGCQKPEVKSFEDKNSNVGLSLSVDRINSTSNKTGRSTTLAPTLLDSLVPITFNDGTTAIQQEINFSSIEGFTFSLENADYQVQSSTDFGDEVTTHLPITIDESLTINSDGVYEVTAVSNHAAISVDDPEGISPSFSVNDNKFYAETVYVQSGGTYNVLIPYTITLNGNTFNGSVFRRLTGVDANTNYVYSLTYIVHQSTTSDLSLSLVTIDPFNNVEETLLAEHVEDECDFANDLDVENSIEPVFVRAYGVSGDFGIALFTDGGSDLVWERDIYIPDPSWDGPFRPYEAPAVAYDTQYQIHNIPSLNEFDLVDNAGSWGDDVIVSYDFDGSTYSACVEGVEDFTIRYVVGEQVYTDYSVEEAFNFPEGIYFVYVEVTHQGESLVLSHLLIKSDSARTRGLRGRVRRPV